MQPHRKIQKYLLDIDSVIVELEKIMDHHGRDFNDFNPTYYSSWEGGDDGANAGGYLGGEKGWSERGGKELFFGTIALVTAPATLAASSGIGTVGAVVGTVDAADNVTGVFLTPDPNNNYNYQSFTQSLFTSQDAKNNVGAIKGFLGVVNFSTGSWGTLNNLNRVEDLKSISEGVNAIADGFQTPQSIQDIIKAIPRQ